MHAAQAEKIAGGRLNLRFETQDADEVVLFLLRRHLATNISWILNTVLLAILPIIVVPVLLLFRIEIPSILPAFQTFVLICFYYLLVLGYALVQFLIWYYAVNIITNERVIDVDFTSFLFKKKSESPLENIQDVTYQVQGGFQVLFHYGTVTVQTEGPRENIEFDNIPDPSHIQHVLGNLVEEVRKKNATR